MNARNLTVFGAGYIGLVTAACLAELGHAVTVMDIQDERIAELLAGRTPLYEPGLEELLARNAERLRFTVDAHDAAKDAQVIYVCVDTPPLASGDADLSRIWAVLDSVGQAEQAEVLVVKSTVPVGTGAAIRVAMDANGLGAVAYAANPEFTAEGQAVANFMNPDRVVIGGWDERAIKIVADLHDGISAPIITMDVESAEMVKLASNAFLMARISLINEVANVCELTGADISRVAEAVGLDHRVGPHFLQAGLGYGGSCFPKDSLALKQMASNSGYHFQLLNAVIEVNELQKRRAVQKLKNVLGTLRGKRIALLGLTYKPGTDDMREAASIVLATRLLAEGAAVSCWDPMAPTLTEAPWTSTERFATPLEALDGADAAILTTEWRELDDLPWAEAAARMRGPVLLDGRNALDPETARRAGLTYLGMGRT
jgi:UDPglucose 6-dehydrogenase